MNSKSTISWIWFFWKNHKKYFFVLVFFTAVSTSVAIAYPLLFKYLIDFFVQKLASGSQEHNLKTVYQATGIILLVGFLQVFSNLYPAMRARVNQRLEVDIRQHYFARLLQKNWKFFQKFRTGDIATRLCDDTASISWFACSGIFRAIESSSKFIFCIGLLFTLNIKLAIVSFLPLPVMLFAFYSLQSFLTKYMESYRQEVSQTGNLLESCFSGIKILKAHRAEASFSKNFKAQLQKRIGIGMTLNSFQIVLWAIYSSIGVSGQIIVILYGGYLALEKEITLGVVYAFYMYLGMLTGPLFDIPNFFTARKQTMVNIRRLVELEETGCETELKESWKNHTELEQLHSIEFKDVSFQYNDKKIVHDVSFKLEKGKTVVLFGKIGSGKTTLLKLLLGLIKPDCGEIFVNGISIEKIHLPSYWQKIGYVSQEPSLFSDSIYENITLGRNISLECTQKALKECNLLEEIKNMPKGIHETLSFKGSSFSGGQKQRLCISRAIAGNPQLYLLDDCSSALDAENEKFIWDSIQNCTKENMALVVTHRPHSMRYADEIYFLQDQNYAR